jgi:1-acyl-sn-glycerol-3-phosphate acyltransferase
MPAVVSALIYEISYWATFFVWMIGFRMRVYGREHFPRRGPVLVVANHQSLLDPIAIGNGIPRHAHFLARKTLFRNPIFAFWLHAVHAVPIDQEGVGKEGIKTIVGSLANGWPVLIFPEGQRTFDGQLQPLKPGVGLVVNRARAPIVPVGIAGAYEAWPRHKTWPTPSPLFLPQTRRSLVVVFGRPRDRETLDGLSREQVLAVLQEDIAAVVQEAKKRWEKPLR